MGYLPGRLGGAFNHFPRILDVRGAPVEKSTKYLDKIKAAASVKDARPAIDATQKYVWDELPFTLIGHKVNINAVSTHVKGYDFNLGPVFYNVSVNK